MHCRSSDSDNRWLLFRYFAMILFSSFQATKEIKELRRNRMSRFMIFIPLEKVFRGAKYNTITLTFSGINDIIGQQLPPGAKLKRFWLETGDGCPSCIWMQYGFTATYFDYFEEKIVFQRLHRRKSYIQLPDWVYNADLPEGLVDEVEKFMRYVGKNMR